MSAMNEPIVFANGWKCGDVLTPRATTACPVAAASSGEEDCPEEGAAGESHKRSLEYKAPNVFAKPKYKFYEKRDGFACPAQEVKRHCMKKRHGDEEHT